MRNLKPEELKHVYGGWVCGPTDGHGSKASGGSKSHGSKASGGSKTHGSKASGGSNHGSGGSKPH